MTLPFFKYQGTGNDFVMIDQRSTIYLQRNDQATIEQLCDRRFGVGADGLILLSPPSVSEPKLDFDMIYFNADGRESSMCGNGGRCLVAFAHHLQVFDNQCVFNAIDGLHAAKVRPDGWVELKMIDVKNVEIGKDYFLMNTGSPHFVVFVEDLTDINIFEAGRQIRYSERFQQEGVNVNFVEIKKDKTGIEVATYERGVEDETYSCGTGVTAAAIAYALHQNTTDSSIIVPIQTKGGQLEVRFVRTTEGVFSEIWLCGPAQRVYAGAIEINHTDANIS